MTLIMQWQVVKDHDKNRKAIRNVYSVIFQRLISENYIVDPTIYCILVMLIFDLN
jgi:hypothetical protein